MSKFWEKIKNYLKLREERRDLDFYELDLFNILKFIFIRGQVNDDIIKKKLRLNDFKFKDYLDALQSKGYIKKINKNSFYTITSKGTDYLLQSKKIKQERRNNLTILSATIVLAISALIEVINILLNNERTWNFIREKAFQFFSELIKVVFIFVIIIICLSLLILFINWFKRHIKPKKFK
ncbi:MAG: winged helix-turn-helix domain-containing protein [Candidatus Pacearchaeota archaeon]|jgi:predicted transcriptional regulator